LHVTPLSGVTLLHLAIEYDELEIAEWLLGKGAEVDARAMIDADDFGGQTALFHSVVTLGARDDAKARLLLEHGANPNARATFRKHLRDGGEEQPLEYGDVTPIGYAKRFREPSSVSRPAVELLRLHGGGE